MAVPVVVKPATQVSNKGKAITPLKIKVSSGTPLTTTKWKVEKGLPAGLSAAIVGEEFEITGTPTTVETTTVGVIAHNAEGNSVESTFTWEVKAELSTVTKPATQTTRKGVAATELKVSATNSPTEYKATGLPVGLSINSSSGAITGTPTIKETAKVKLSVENAGGVSAEVEFEWVVLQTAAEYNESVYKKAEEAVSTHAGWSQSAGW